MVSDLFKLHEDGLTWHQMGLYFGVSDRAVHYWASGGQMPESKRELVEQLVAIPPEQRLAAIDEQRRKNATPIRYDEDGNRTETVVYHPRVEPEAAIRAAWPPIRELMLDDGRYLDLFRSVVGGEDAG